MLKHFYSGHFLLRTKSKISYIYMDRKTYLSYLYCLFIVTQFFFVNVVYLCSHGMDEIGDRLIILLSRSCV